jgi:hypothetical protein
MDLLEFLIELLGSSLGRTLVIIVSVVLAGLSIHSARTTARRKQTADLLITSRGDEMLQKGAQTITRLHKATDKNMRILADPVNYDSEDATCVRYVLNHFETVSIGIQAGIYDEDMLKKCWCSMLVSTFERTRPLISALREANARQTVMQEFEWLALRWQADPLKVRNKHRTG